MHESSSPNKTELRTWATKVRRQLSTQLLSQAICRHLEHFLRDREIEHVLTYKAFGTEPNPVSLETSYKVNYYLPRVDGETLTVHQIPCELVKNPLGMWEPSPSVPEVDPNLIQAVLVPGLCFDLQGYRIGYGKGFYDRFFAYLDQNPITIGLTSEQLIVETLPHEEWDFPMNFLASEGGIKKIAPGF